MVEDPKDDPGLRTTQDDALVALFMGVGFGDVVRYDHLRSQWYYWNGIRWHVDKMKHVYDMVRVYANELWNSTPDSDGDKRKMLLPIFNYAKKESFLRSLAVREGIAMRGTEWDTDPYLLGFENGLMDLRTGVFDEHPSPTTLVSKSVGVDWDPDATYDTFNGFMSSIFPDSPEVLRYMYTLLGYSLFGLQSEQKFWMWVGRGSNGKGILARTMVHVMGDYAETPSDTLYMKTKIGPTSSSAARPDLVRLQGARFTYMSEPPGKQFNEELLKAHTGEDMVLARDLYSRAGEMAQFPPTHKIIFLTNEPPATEDVGVSMRRRARLIRFEQDFSTPDRSNPKIEEAVKAEKQGILVALVSLARYWYSDGLAEPDQVTAWSNEYIEENDPLAKWLTEDCSLDRNDKTNSGVLYGDYEDWCARHNLETKSNKAFSDLLSKRFRKDRTRNGAVFTGLRLKPIEHRAGGDDGD